MNRSHSRHSYPLDKSVPMMEKSQFKYGFYVNHLGETVSFKSYIGYDSTGRQAKKEMHKTKQRQYNRKLCREHEQ